MTKEQRVSSNRIECLTVHRETAEARANMYKFFSDLCLGPPTQEVIDQVLDDELIDELSYLLSADSIEHFRKFAASVSDGNGLYEGLRQEYMDLFQVPTGKYVTPYEAVFRDERDVGGRTVKGLLMGPSTVAVKEMYRQAGAEVSGEFADLPDHIGLELQFMHFLCDKEHRALEDDDADAFRDSLRMEVDFLSNHLTQWIRDLCDKLCDKTDNDFYKGTAIAVRDFVINDEIAVNNLLEDTKPFA